MSNFFLLPDSIAKTVVISVIAALSLILLPVTIINSCVEARVHGPQKPPQGRTVNVKSFGATGKGVKDDTAAINRAAVAAGTNGTIYFPSGTYNTSSPISLNFQNVTGVGTSSIVRSTNLENGGAIFNLNGGGSVSYLQLRANDSDLDGIRVHNIKAPFSIQHITTQGDFATLIQLDGGSANGTISNNTLSMKFNPGTPQSFVLLLGDGCDNVVINDNVFTTASANGIVARPVFTLSCSNKLTISNNQFLQLCPQPISLTGVSNCIISSNTMNFSNSQAYPPVGISIYGDASSPPGYGKGPCSNVKITGNKMIYCGSASLGAIELSGTPSGAQPGLSNIQITSNAFTQLPLLFDFSWSSAVHTSGSAGGIQDLVISDNTATGIGYSGFWIEDTRNATVSNNTINSGAGEGVYLGNNNAGTVNISNNTMTNLGSATSLAIKSANVSVRAAIDIDEGSSGTKPGVTSNVYNAPANGLRYFVYCSVSQSNANVAGNKTGTMLPTYVAP